MKISGFLTVMAVAAVVVPSASGGSFRRISIDGKFDDWVGVPVAVADDAEAGGMFDFKDVSIANDEQYVYARLRLHAPAGYGAYHHQIVIDGDGNGSTGLAWVGLGSELMIEDGAGYQQKNGQFNEGGASQLGWRAAPLGTVSQVEVRISRQTVDAEGADVFTNPDVVLSFVARNLDWQVTDEVIAVPYSFAATPDRFLGVKTVIGHQSVPWSYEESADPANDWALPEFVPGATWKSGQGFCGFGLGAGVYPAVTTLLTGGRTTYYFRTSFEWEYDTAGVALLADTYLSDGAVMYLNGAEVRRVRLPAGAITGTTQATAPAATPGAIETFSLPVSALAVGTNVLAVEVHQEPGSPGSLGFGLGLRASDSLPPSIEDPGQPADRSVVEGQGTVFSPGVVAGTQPFQFQWFKDGQPIEAATGATFEIPMVLVGDAGAYSVEITHGTATVRSRAAVLTTTAAPVVLVSASEPADRVVTEGESTTFQAAAGGSPLFSYQWYKNGDPIPGATAASHLVDSATLEDAGEYHVTVTNRVNSVSSRRARLVVNPDASAPAVEAISGSSGKIVIRFSEPVETASATNPASYILPGATIVGAELSADQRTVTLSTGPISFGQLVSFRVNAVKDRFGNVLSAPAPFRATLSIDGSFDDWDGIATMASDPDDTGQGGEFKDYSVANDGEFLYLRFSFHREIGPLPVDFYYQLFFDADNDPGTGFPVSGIGSSMMIENGGAWLQRGGGFNEGGVGNTGFLLAPAGASSEFECRVSLRSTVNADQSLIFDGETIGIALNLLNTGWAVVDRGPATQPVSHTLMEWLPVSPEAAFAITSLTRQIGTSSLSVSWNSTAGSTYAIDTSTDLDLWAQAAEGIPSAGSGITTHTLSVPGATPGMFIRVRKQ